MSKALQAGLQTAEDYTEVTLPLSCTGSLCSIIFTHS